MLLICGWEGRGWDLDGDVSDSEAIVHSHHIVLPAWLPPALPGHSASHPQPV